jgi:hypothetical protein
MDLSKQPPRSPNTMMAGIVSLARVIDKTRALAEGNLGAYQVNCTHDRPVLEFLGVNFPVFNAKLKELKYDDARIEEWAKSRLASRSTEAIAHFNASRRGWSPDSASQAHFDELKAQIAPDREDVTTWFQLLDIDDGPPVEAPSLGKGSDASS